MQTSPTDESVLSECAAALERVVREGGDTLAVVRQCVARVLALPAPPFDDPRIALLLSLARHCIPGRTAAILPLAERIEADACRLRDPSMRAVALNVLGVALNEAGRDAQALATLRRALSEADQYKQAWVQSAAPINMGLIFQRMGDFAEAREAFELAKARAIANDVLGPRLSASNNLAYAKFLSGESDAALGEAEDALALVPAFPSTQDMAWLGYSAMLLHGLCAVVHAERHRLDRADAHLAREQEWCERRNDNDVARWDCRVDRLFVDAVGRRNGLALESMSAAYAELTADLQAFKGYSVLYQLYLASRALGSDERASEALEGICELLTRRRRLYVDGLANSLPPEGGLSTPQIEAFRDSLQAALTVPQVPQAGAWAHLLQLAVSASAEEDGSRMHPRRTAWLANGLARAVGSTPRQTRIATMSALVHSVGLAAMPLTVLKDAERSPRDERLYRGHAMIGADLIARSGVPDAAAISETVRFHLSPFDGQSGDRAGESLPLTARILAVASTFDSLIMGRPGRPARGVTDALRELLRQRDRDFDPVLVDRFILLVRELPADRQKLIDVLANSEDMVVDEGPCVSATTMSQAEEGAGR